MKRFSAPSSAALALAVLLAGCGGGGSSPAAAQGGRAPRTLMLSESDVAVVITGRMEEGVPITGVLQPSQTISVRSRLEGDIEGVYVREGEPVRSGQVLARFEASEQVSEQQSARAERVAAQGELATAQWNLEQTQELYRAGAVAERDLRTAQQAVTTARARVAAAAAREQSTGSTVRDTRVLAPANAVVERRVVEPGERVARGAELFTLVRNETLELNAAVPERLATRLAPGQTVRFDAAGQTFEGRVARVSPTIDPTTRSVTVYVQVPNARGQLRGGTFASGVVVARTVESTTMVPLPAVRQTAEGEQFVYRIAGNVVEQVPVTLGVVNAAGGRAEVTSGLAPGDRVIVGNVGTVGRGMQVQILGGDRPPSTGGDAGSDAVPAAPAPATQAAPTQRER
jgi:membrane fusion protein (multidrug efflux system)